MVDCGAFQGRRSEADAKNRSWSFDASQVEATILTHAHYDHSGLVPMLPKKGFNGNIYTTPASRDLASLIMMDSAHIQAKDYEFLRKRAKRKGELFQKQDELMKPLQNKIFNIIQEIAAEEDLDFVFDRSGDIIFLYAKSDYDLTARVLEKLQLE